MIEILLSATAIAIHAGAVLSLLLYERRQPSATLAWVLALIFLPFVGLFLFFLVGRPASRRIAGRYAEVVERVEKALEAHAFRAKATGREPTDLDPREDSLLRLTQRLSSTPSSHCNHTEMLVDGRATYTSMAEAVAGARHHVHVEFYIIQPDETGQRMRELLVEKAEQGVQVRVLCDAVGSGNLPADFWAALHAAGGQSGWFRPVAKILTRLPFRDRIDFRNHRKIVITDGRIGFTGGINVGKEYLGLDPALGEWRDTHVRIEGPAVLGLQKVFVEDWLAATDELLADESLFPDPDDDCGTDHVQVVDSGPDRVWSPIEQAFAHAFALSRDRLWITSPYFVPSVPVESALTAAALRGVDVRLLVPLRPDKGFVMMAAESYFPNLLRAGVKIFQYERGFVHAKTLVVDDWLATIGSANMDIRSFHLNYELDAFLFGEEPASQLAEQFERDLASARPLTAVSSKIHRRLLRAGARMLSPLL